MTQEQKNLLLKDLGGRLPYGVKIFVDDRVETLEGIDMLDTVVEYSSYLSSDIEEVKPYLFPLSSMTIEKKGECPCGWSMIDAWIDGSIYLFEDEELNIDEIINLLDWLNKNHFDYRGLIPMGLAIDATNLNIYDTRI